jgi:alpha-ketoglutarate-dependent taurine dioxygenase
MVYCMCEISGRGLACPGKQSFKPKTGGPSSSIARAREWSGGDRLRTRQVRKAIQTHPVTGEAVWFNHAVFFHVSTLEPTTKLVLSASLSEEDLPNNTYYGDGSPIEPEVLDHLRDVYREKTVSFPWHRGDILMLDNMLVAHGRSPYQGARKILVGMSELYSA